jgi:DNA-binding NarL/FixJ family response regulator
MAEGGWSVRTSPDRSSMPSHSKRVIVVDRQEVVRVGLRSYLSTRPKPLEVFLAANGKELLRLVRTAPFHAVILGLSLQDTGGFELLGRLHEIYPELPVIFFSVCPESEYGAVALRVGAAGYVEKASSLETLGHAVDQVLSGGIYISPSLAAWLVEYLSEAAPHPDPLDELSAREREVLLRLASGLSATEIARELHLSVKTVSTYRGRCLRKLRLATAEGLRAYAIEHGLVHCGIRCPLKRGFH